MTLPVSGPISLSEVNVELNFSSTAQISLNDAAVRALFEKPSGTISLSDGYGKSNEFAFTVSTNVTNANLATLATNAGWNGTSRVVCTINSGVYISSNATGTPALTVSGSFPSGVDLINNGFIIGMGGAGGAGVSWSSGSFIGGSNGSAGGVALSVSSAISITNNGTIGGGGGGGGGGRGGLVADPTGDLVQAGGGGGGGRSSAAANSAGGTRGDVGGFRFASAGVAGTVSVEGAGGLGSTSGGGVRGGPGGAGGGWGATGVTGGNAVSMTSQRGPFTGGAGGGAVSGNSNVTWVVTGTRLGALT
jgi:hypothetical protein